MKPRSSKSILQAVVVGIFLPCAAMAAWRTSCVVAEELTAELAKLPYKIVYETHRDDNWELFMMRANGADPVNLTRTPNVNEICPHVSPDGRKVAFLVDEGEGTSTRRSGYYMNLDGTDRRLIDKNVRWSCWNAEGTVIAYLPGEPGPFSFKDGTTQGLCFYELAGGKQRQHPNPDIYHVYNPCWSPDDDWILATVAGGMGYRHTNLALQTHGLGVFDLGLRGCRPDISPDGRKVAWGVSDWAIRVGDLDVSGPAPKVVNARDVIVSEPPMMVYHVDWSPDGKYLAFTRGPRAKSLALAPPYLGAKAEGWNICVADASQQNRWVAITTDGKWNKEPDWTP